MGGAEHLAVQIANALAGRGTPLAPDRGHRAGPHERAHLPRGPHPLRRLRAGLGAQAVRLLTISVAGGVRRLGALVAREGIEVLQTHLPGANYWGLLLAWRRSLRRGGHGAQQRGVPLRRARQPGAARGAAPGLRPDRAELRRGGGLGGGEGESGAATGPGRRAGRAHHGGAQCSAGAASRWTRSGARRCAARFGVGPGETFLLAAGRFTAQKNFGDLVTAAGLLAADGCPSAW